MYFMKIWKHLRELQEVILKKKLQEIKKYITNKMPKTWSEGKDKKKKSSRNDMINILKTKYVIKKNLQFKNKHKKK